MDGAIDGRVVSEIGIAMAVERLLRAGYHVAVPLIDDGYDLLAFAERRYWRIQVKASASNGNRSNRSRIRIGRGSKKQTAYEASHVDAFICVNTRTSVVMCVPVSETSGRRWLNWSQADRWSDLDVLRRIKQQRCLCSRPDQRSRNQNGRA